MARSDRDDVVGRLKGKGWVTISRLSDELRSDRERRMTPWVELKHSERDVYKRRADRVISTLKSEGRIETKGWAAEPTYRYVDPPIPRSGPVGKPKSRAWYEGGGRGGDRRSAGWRDKHDQSKNDDDDDDGGGLGFFKRV